MPGQFIDFGRSGSARRAYFAVPEAGRGPGLVIFQDVGDDDRDLCDLGNLYASEGYVVFCPEPSLTARESEDVGATIAALSGRSECTGKIGALGFGVGGEFAYLAAVESGVDCAVCYYGLGIECAPNLVARISCPLVLHFAEKDPGIPPEAVARVRKAFAGRPDVAVYVYAGAAPGFARHTSTSYDKPAAGLAYSRSIGLLRQTLGPRYDLEALWETHTLYEFGTRDVDATMRTSNWWRFRERLDPTGSSTRWWFRSPTMWKSTGCCPAFLRRDVTLRFPSWQSSISAAKSFITNTSTGIRRASSFKSGCSIPGGCRSPASRSRKSFSMRPGPRIP